MTARGVRFLLLVGLIIAVAGILFLSHETEIPRIDAPGRVILGRTPKTVSLSISDDRSGLRRVSVRLHHADGVVDLLTRSFPGQFLVGSSRRKVEIDVVIEANALDLEEGDASLEVSAEDWSLWATPAGNRVSQRIPVRIDLSPPRILVESGLTYVRRGGSAAVVYSVDEIVDRDGVEVGDIFFPGFPFPAKSLGKTIPLRSAGRRFALFAIPRDSSEHLSVRVIGVDGAGNRTSAKFPVRIQERDFEQVRIDLPPRFLKFKIRDLQEKMGTDAPDMIGAFQKINGEIRTVNEKQIRELAAMPDTERHWRGVFRQMRGSAVTSRFAEERSYYVEGEKIAEATHYGYDLASTANATVTASNSGRVIFAGELGIYGNCVLISHGLGLTTLYGHLSDVAVSVGDPVEKEQTIGSSGKSGLAGGDHLHFAILVGAVYVDPMEWWDPRWVREHIEARLKSTPR